MSSERDVNSELIDRLMRKGSLNNHITKTSLYTVENRNNSIMLYKKDKKQAYESQLSAYID